MVYNKKQTARRVAQTTVGPHRDIRIDERPSGMYEFVEVVYPVSDIPTRPVFVSKLLMNREGVERLASLLNMLLDSLDGLQGARELPINDSDSVGVNDEQK